MLKTFRKYYLPGIISLVGVPLILLSIYMHVLYDPEFCFEIYLNKQNDSLMQKELSKISKSRMTHEIYLEEYGDNTYLIKSSFLKIRNIEIDADTANIYTFTNVNKIYYKDFVELLNQANMHRIQNYTLINDKFSLFYTKPILQEKPIEYKLGCGTLTYNIEEHKRKKKTERKMKNQKILLTYKIPLLLSGFGIIFFYYILPFIQSKISSKETTTLL